MTGTPVSSVPPHCPRSDCRYHRCAIGWRWKRHGTYTRQCEPRVIPRYRCGHCGATFSSQSFSNTYYLKRPDLLVAVAHRMVTCAGYRQMAREARCSPSTIARMAGRLGRFALLYMTANRPRGTIEEPVALDGFEGFAFSQYQPLHLNLVVGTESHYLYAFTQSSLRRKGRMTDAQKKRRARLEALHGRPDPKAIEKDCAQALAIAAPLAQALVVRSDEHQAYPRALARLPHLHITHERTPSTDARTASNPLFPVNLKDLHLRHNSANHKRETIAFSKRHQGAIDRAAWLLCWLNECKPFSERHGGGTPAMRAGLRATRLGIETLLSQRLFVTRTELPQVWRHYYFAMVDTPGIQNPRRHLLKLAL